MSLFNSIFVADLSKLSTGYAIINQFVDDESVRLLEISPCGTEAQIVLSFADEIVAQIVNNECRRFFSDSMLASALLKLNSNNILETMFHQNKPEIKKHLMIVESCYLSDVLSISAKVDLNLTSLVEIRTIRTNPKSCLLILTSDSLEEFNNIKKFTDSNTFKFDVIQDVNSSLKNLFEIKK